MPDDASADARRALRDAMGCFATGVTVVTTRGTDGSDVGRTANSFSSVSLDPPMVLWSLARSSSGYAHFEAAEHFAVHVLGAHQDDLSTLFAGKSSDRFAGLDVDRGRDGIPMLGDCAARFECRTVYRYEGGDHTIFVGEVVDFRQSHAAPLLFHGGRYGRLLRQTEARPPSERPESLGDANLAYLLSRGLHELRAASAAIRSELDFPDEGYALMTVLGHEGALPRSTACARASQRGTEVHTTDCDALIARGWLQATGDPDDPTLAPGPQARDAMIRVLSVIRAVEADMLSRLGDENEGRVLLDLLGKLVSRDRQGWPPVPTPDQTE